MHLVGFIIRIYHEARSPERQNQVKVTAASLHCPMFRTGSFKQTHTQILILQLDGKERAIEGRLGPPFVFNYTAVIAHIT